MEKPQELLLELMRCASFNNFDGNQVVNDLIAHKQLWSAALIDRVDDFIKLRDLPDNWNVDTVYITPKTGKELELLELATKWDADEIEYVKLDLGQYPNNQKILKLWWD